MEPNRFLSLWVSLLMATLTMLCPQIISAAGATSTEINNTIVQEGSVPLTWENDAVYPWTIIDGKLRSGNMGKKYSTSKISIKYSSQYPTSLNFTYDVQGSNNRINVYIDGVRHIDDYSSTGIDKLFRLPKGNHIVEFRDTISNNSATNAYTQIYNVKVTEYPGASLGEINETIVQDGSLPLTWVQDENYPWRLVNGKLQSSNWGFPNSTSKVSFRYSSQYQ